MQLLWHVTVSHLCKISQLKCYGFRQSLEFVGFFLFPSYCVQYTTSIDDSFCIKIFSQILQEILILECKLIPGNINSLLIVPEHMSECLKSLICIVINTNSLSVSILVQSYSSSPPSSHFTFGYVRKYLSFFSSMSFCRLLN